MSQDRPATPSPATRAHGRSVSTPIAFNETAHESRPDTSPAFKSLFSVSGRSASISEGLRRSSISSLIDQFPMAELSTRHGSSQSSQIDLSAALEVDNGGKAGINAMSSTSSLIEAIKMGRAEPPDDDQQAEGDDSTPTVGFWGVRSTRYRPPRRRSPARALPYTNINDLRAFGQSQDPERRSFHEQAASYVPEVQPRTPPHNRPGEQDPIVLMLESKTNHDIEILRGKNPFVCLIGPCPKDVPGLLKIGNMPFTSSRCELVAFLGRNAKLRKSPEGTPYDAVHIGLERFSGKSNDGWAEFVNKPEAILCAAKFRKPNDEKGQEILRRLGHIGARTVEITIATVDDLMKEIFPSAKRVTWHGNMPVVDPPSEYSTGFQQFITEEELFQMTRLADQPQRSHYVQKHNQRVYENMISIVSKYPWFATDLYTVGERDQIAQACKDTIAQLVVILKDPSKPETLTFKLLEELLTVALACPAFNERQRIEIQRASGYLVGQPRWISHALGDDWPFNALRPDDTASEARCRWFAQLIKNYTVMEVIKKASNGDADAKKQLDKFGDNTFGLMSDYLYSVRPSPKATMASAIQHDETILDMVLEAWAKKGFQTIKDDREVIGMQSVPSIYAIEAHQIQSQGMRVPPPLTDFTDILPLSYICSDPVKHISLSISPVAPSVSTMEGTTLPDMAISNASPLALNDAPSTTVHKSHNQRRSGYRLGSKARRARQQQMAGHLAGPMVPQQAPNFVDHSSYLQVPAHFTDQWHGSQQVAYAPAPTPQPITSMPYSSMIYAPAPYQPLPMTNYGMMGQAATDFPQSMVNGPQLRPPFFPRPTVTEPDF